MRIYDAFFGGNCNFETRVSCPFRLRQGKGKVQYTVVKVDRGAVHINRSSMYSWLRQSSRASTAFVVVRYVPLAEKDMLRGQVDLRKLFFEF
jgi:hypothetical protein